MGLIISSSRIGSDVRGAIIENEKYFSKVLAAWPREAFEADGDFSFYACDLLGCKTMLA